MHYFSVVCVAVVICLLLLFVTELLGDILSIKGSDNYFTAWFISNLAFGICLTLMLCHNGII